MAVDDVAGTIDIKRGPKALGGAHPRALIPPPPIDNDEAEAAIQRLAEHVIEHGLHAPGPYRAALDLLLRTRRDPDAGPFDTSYLAIQGPPGSGKTTRGAELIIELVQAGKRVGITAHSHAVIGNSDGGGGQAGHRGADAPEGQGAPALPGRHRRVDELAERSRAAGRRVRRDRRHHVAVGTRGDGGFGRRALRRRGGAEVTGRRARGERRGDAARAARRSAAARAAVEGESSRGRGGVGARARARRARDDARGSRLVPGVDVPDAPAASASSSRRSRTTDGCTSRRARGSSARRSTASRGCGTCRWCTQGTGAGRAEKYR